MNRFDRTISLIGELAFNKLSNSNILVAGCGGVGGYVIESLARAGLGTISIIDYDIIDITNINRQIIALESNIGKLKIDEFEKRLKDINPLINVIKYNIKIDDDTINKIDFTNCNYIIDAVDDVNAKILLIKKSKELNIKILSSMGTAKKTDPSKFKISDISKTEVCPLAKKVRLKLRELNIKDVKVLYSTENIKDINTLGTLSTIPSIAGLLISNEVIKDIING